jgi:GrpB-like predicted nucleotidyltransferase (UPF0157 family)
MTRGEWFELVGEWIAADAQDAQRELEELIPRLIAEVPRRRPDARLIGTHQPRGGRRFFGIETRGDVELAGYERLALPAVPDPVDLFARAWVGDAGGPDDAIEIVGYDERWPLLAQELAEDVRRRLSERLVLRVEHYGSTAVPGLAAKPVVDLLVEIPSIASAHGAVFSAYEGRNEECWLWDHLLVILRERPYGPRIAHLHLAPAGHPIWEGLRFRDALRADAELRERYEALKRELAEKHAGDREAYTRAKTEFVSAALGGTGR